MEVEGTESCAYTHRALNKPYKQTLINPLLQKNRCQKLDNQASVQMDISKVLI